MPIGILLPASNSAIVNHPLQIDPLSRIRTSLCLGRNLLLALALFNVACSVADSTGDLTASSEQEIPELTSVKKPFSPTPVTGEDIVSIATAIPDTDNPSGLQLGMALPEISLATLDAESDSVQTDTQTTEQAIVTQALCTAPESDMRQRMLQLINDARTTARFCGDNQYPATGALRWSDELTGAARRHSTDMATHNFFNHTGSDGSVASVRVTEAGYRWQSIYENIAAGHDTAGATLNAWLDSPGSCRNIMNPAFTDVAVSCVDNDDSDYQYYWTSLLAEPR